MENGPLVSIVTPCFNSATYLELCIQSVQNQTYPYVEHIIQDAASKDGTLEILQRYNGKIDWVSEKDKGQADGLDRALKRCRGDIILVLNADDELLPHACQWGVDHLLAQPELGAVYGDQLNVGPDGEVLSEFIGPEYDFEAMFCCEMVIPAQAAFMRRSALEAVGLGTDASLRTCPDYEMWVRLGLQFSIRHEPGILARYRYHVGSEGQQAAMVPLMLASKRSVMERTWAQPDCPPRLRGLKGRARAGLLIWGALVAMSHGSVRYAWRLFIRSTRWQRNRSTALSLLSLFKRLPLWERVPLVKQTLKWAVGIARQTFKRLQAIIRHK